MARLYPAKLHPNVSSPGEREIFERFASEPGMDDWIVLHSLNLAEHPTQVMGEIDFVVIVPRQGVIVVEVKAVKSIARGEADGLWRIGQSDPTPRSPWDQVRGAVHALRDYVDKADPRLTACPLLGLVLLPYTPCELQSIEWAEWELRDARTFARPLAEQLGTALRDYRRYLAADARARWFRAGDARPTADEARALCHLLRPAFERVTVVRANPGQRKVDLARATDEQLDALEVLGDNERVLYYGPAGTGKTVLSIEAARRAVGSGRRTLFLCFNRLLANWLNTVLQDLASDLTVRTLHAHLLEVAGERAPAGAGPDYWAHQLPTQAIARLYETGGEDSVYDTLVIDEAQDIVRTEYLEFLDLSLRGGLKGGQWQFFGDFDKQAIYTRDDLRQALKDRGATFTAFALSNNCRNTPLVARAAASVGTLNPGYRRVLRSENGFTPEVLSYKDAGDQVEQLEALLDRLVGRGFDPADIVILSRLGEASAAHRLSLRWRQRLQPLSPYPVADELRAGTIHAFKGLEAPVVIITDIDGLGTEDLRQLHYIALTRCLDHVVLLVSKTVAHQMREQLAL